jgi:hypothetical protein
MAAAPRRRIWTSRLRRCAPITVVFFLLAIGLACAEEPASPPPRPGREVSLPRSEVKDTFFAFLLGLISSGTEIDVDNQEMREILVEFTSVLNVPADLITRFAQRVSPETGEQRLELDFVRDVVVPVPFALLFYHPGSVRMTRAIVFDVTRSTMSAADAGAAGTPGSPVYFLTLTEGSIFADIDAWLEALFSAQLEDSWIVDVVFFRWRGEWIGMLEGTGKTTGRIRRAYFDYTKNEIVFPAPDSLKSIGRKLSRDSSQP